MICNHVKVGDVTMIVCGSRAPRKRCKSCGRWADRECDFPLQGEKKGKTCDAPLCSKCTSRPAPDTDLCLAHARYLGSLGSDVQQVIIDEMRQAADVRVEAARR